MSLWKFGNFEEEVDFNDADFLDALEEAKDAMDQKIKNVPKTGKRRDLIRAQCACFYTFFDVLFGEGAGEAIFEGKNSLELCIRATESICAFEKLENERVESTYGKYFVQSHGNRQQRRNYQKNQKQQKKYYPRRQG